MKFHSLRYNESLVNYQAPHKLGGKDSFSSTSVFVSLIFLFSTGGEFRVSSVLGMHSTELHSSLFSFCFEIGWQWVSVHFPGRL